MARWQGGGTEDARAELARVARVRRGRSNFVSFPQGAVVPPRAPPARRLFCAPRRGRIDAISLASMTTSLWSRLGDFWADAVGSTSLRTTTAEDETGTISESEPVEEDEAAPMKRRRGRPLKCEKVRGAAALAVRLKDTGLGGIGMCTSGTLVASGCGSVHANREMEESELTQLQIVQLVSPPAYGGTRLNLLSRLTKQAVVPLPPPKLPLPWAGPEMTRNFVAVAHHLRDCLALAVGRAVEVALVKDTDLDGPLLFNSVGGGDMELTGSDLQRRVAKADVLLLHDDMCVWSVPRTQLYLISMKLPCSPYAHRALPTLPDQGCSRGFCDHSRGLSHAEPPHAAWTWRCGACRAARGLPLGGRASVAPFRDEEGGVP